MAARFLRRALPVLRQARSYAEAVTGAPQMSFTFASPTQVAGSRQRRRRGFSWGPVSRAANWVSRGKMQNVAARRESLATPGGSFSSFVLTHGVSVMAAQRVLLIHWAVGEG